MNSFLRSHSSLNTSDLAVFDTTSGSSTRRISGRSLFKGLMLLGVFALGLLAGEVNAQLTPVTYDFNANSTGWTGDITRTTATSACGSASMRRNLYSGATTGNLVSPLLAGTNVGTQVTISYKYKAANWSANTVGTNPWGSFDVQYGSSATGPWTTFATVSQETQNGSCITKTHTFTPPTGNLYIKWACTWTAGDYYINFDDIVISQDPPPACTGMPNTPVATLTGASSVCAGATKNMTATGLTFDLGISNQWMVSSTSGSGYVNVTDGTGGTTSNYTTAALAAGTYYYVLSSTCTNSGEVAYSNELAVTVNALPTIAISASSVCGVTPLTASGASTYSWSPSNLVSATTGATVNYVGTTSSSVTVSGTDANGCVGTLVQPITFTAPDPITITSGADNFCGAGGTTTLTAAASTANYAYTWSSLQSGTLSNTSGASTDFTVASSAAAQVTGYDAGSGCTAVAVKSVGVYPLPTAVVTTTASGVCPGTPATINSGLSAGNFTVTSIAYNWSTPPANAGVLMNNGVAITPLSGGSMDDGGWGGIPIGFNFNYFGSSFSTLAAGTNGVLMFGTVPGYGTANGQLGQFTFSGPPYFPNAANPGNVIALLAADMQMANSTSGSIKYWTEGYAPNRVFVISYNTVHGWSSNPSATVQCKLYETLGVVEILIQSKTFSNAAIVGLQDATKTVGAVAPGRTGSWTVSTPEAWRFSPPSNYTVNWYADNVLFDSGTNVFSESVAPLATTEYSILYTNQLTNCSNALTPASVTMLVLSDVAPSGLSAVSSAASVCSGAPFTLSTDYTGLLDGLAFQWQVSTDGGASWTDITGATAATYSATQTVASSYRVGISSCGGSVEYTSQIDVLMNSFIDCYCNSSALYSSDEEILNVTLGTLNNTSDCSTPAPGAGSTLNLYSNFTTIPAVDLLPGTPASGSFTVGTCGSWNYTSGAAVFIDFNQNGSFSDPGEMVWNNGTTYTITCLPSSVVPFSFTVPMTATTGLTRMRIIDIEFTGGSSINPCGNYGYGETEDYLVNILPPPPAPTVAMVDPMNACPGSQVTITGSDFLGITSVTFNGTPATSFTVVSTSQINAVVPTSVSGLASVEVINAGGTGTGAVLLYPAATTSISGQLGLCGSTPASLTASGTGSFSWTVADGCTYSISLMDTYGDGWNGGQIDVLVDGVLVYDNITLAGGTGPEYHDFSVFAGSTIVVNQVVLGSYTGEQHYNIYSGPAGTGSAIYVSPNGIPATHTETATLCGSTPLGSTVVGSGATLAATSAGLYTVQFTDLNGCNASASAAVASHEVPVISTPSQVTACEGGTVDIVAVETTGLAGVSYTWYNQQGDVVGNTASITTPNMFADDYYSVTASTIYCVSDTAYTGIVVSQLSGIVLTPINASCYGYADGSFTQTELCGTAPYLYSVVPQGNPVGTYGPLPTNLTAGTYNVYVQDANGNESLPIDLTITSPDAIAATVTTSGAEICSGLTVGEVQAVVGNGTSSASFGQGLQSPGPATTFGPITVDVPAGATISSMSLVLTNIQSNYWAEMRVALNGGVTLPTQSISTFGSGIIPSITVNIPAANYVGGPVNLVLSESYDDFGIDATFGNVQLNITYTYPQTIMWFADANATSFLGMGSPLNVVGTYVCPSPAVSGTYTVYAAYTDGSCIGATAPAVLNVSGLSGVVLTPINLSCFGSNDGSFTQTEACGTAPYAYSVVSAGQPVGTYGSLPTNLAAGTYDVYIQDANGELAGPISITITEPALLPTTETTDGTACIGASVGEVSALAQFVGSVTASSGDVNLPVISNAGAVNAPISVTSIPAGSVITGIDVHLNMTHTWDSDASISLTGPNGIIVDLSSGNGGSGDNYLNTTFSSSATNSITGGNAPFSGVFAPEGDLSTLFGNTNGTWTLSAIDNVGGDNGNIQNWSITFNYLQPGDVIWFGDAAGTQFLGTGATLNVVGTSVLPTATQGTYTVYAASFDGNCHGLLVPATLEVGQPLIPTLSSVVLGSQSPILTSNYSMTGLSSASFSQTLSLPAGAVITSAFLNVENVVAQGFSTNADILFSASGAASMNQVALGTSFANLNGESFTFPVTIDPNGGVFNVNITNNQGWWGDQVSFGAIYLEVSYFAPTEEVVCPGANVQLAVTTTGGGGAQSYVWYNNGVVIPGETSSVYTTLVNEGDSFTVGVSDDCNTNVLSNAFTPVYATNSVLTIAGPSAVLINDITSATPGMGTYTLAGETTNAVINWYYSTAETGPWIPLATNAMDTLLIDFAGANGIYYFTTEVVYPAGCTNWSNVIAVDVANAIDFPCFAAELTVGDQNGFVWNTASATVDAAEVAPPADGCNVQTGWCESTLDGTVWFKFVAPASGHVGIQAPGFDDQLAVYSVGNCFDYSTFTLINANDDDGSGVGVGQMYSALLSDVKCLTPGQTYYVQLDAFTGTGTTTMILVDLGNQAPTITDVPTDISVSNDVDQCGAVVFWDAPTISDDQDCFDFTVDHMQGEVFPIGTTAVTYTAFDIQGDTTVYSFNVTVTDSQAPVMTCLEDITVMVGLNECSYPSSSLDFPTASDNCGIASITSNLDEILYYGTYNVVYTATDVNGTTTICNRVVTVVENPNSVWPTDLTVDGDGTFCAGSSIGIHATVGNYTYQWVYNNNLLPLETSSSIDALQSGDYFCILTNEFGCQTTTNAVTVTSVPNVDYYLDADGDGYGAGAAVSSCTGAPAGYVANNTDCNDADALINPAATEILDNNVDENCDGVIEIGVIEVVGSNMNVFPNPTTGHITLNVSSDLMGETYRIYDGVGKVVAAGRVSAANQELELGALSAGTYMLSIRESHIRIMVQH